MAHTPITSRTAPVVACPNCGAPLSVTLGQWRAHCEACNVDVEVPASVRAQANAYFEALQSQRDVEGFEHERARLYAEKRAKTRAWARRTLWLFPCVALLAFWALAMPTGSSPSAGVWADLALLVASAVVANRVLAAWLSRTTSPSSVESDLPWEATCESCGSNIRFSPGATEARCPYCQATALAPTALEAARVRRATERARAATDEADSAKAESSWAARDNPWHRVILVGLSLTGLLVWYLAQGTPRRLSSHQLLLALMIAVVAGGAWAFLDHA